MSDSDRDVEQDIDRVLEHLQATVVAAIDAAHKAFADVLAAAGKSESPPPRAFFASRVMQLAYCAQCGADIRTFQGGDPKVAWHAIKNAVDISNHYWGATFALQDDPPARRS